MLSTEHLTRIAKIIAYKNNNKPLEDVVEKIVTMAYNQALDNVVAELEKIDFCEYASFTLGLVKEITEKLKGAENG